MYDTSEGQVFGGNHSAIGTNDPKRPIWPRNDRNNFPMIVEISEAVMVFGHVIIKKLNGFSVSDTLVQKMSGHFSICPEFGPFVKSLWIYLDIFIMSGQSGYIYGQESSKYPDITRLWTFPDISGHFRSFCKCPDIRT
jgi:hypothetical protein